MNDIITKTQSHSAAEATETLSIGDATAVSTERMFHCEDCKEDLPVSAAQYPKAANPTMCRQCAVERRRISKDRANAQKRKKHQALDAIPPRSERGDTKRLTISLTAYADAAVAVLSVGTSASDVIERAIINYLESQDAQVLAYVGRVFSKK